MLIWWKFTHLRAISILRLPKTFGVFGIVSEKIVTGIQRDLFNLIGDMQELQPQLQSDIARLLELIQQSNRLLDSLKEAGRDDTDLMERQEKHLQRQYITELDRLMKPFKLRIRLQEE